MFKSLYGLFYIWALIILALVVLMLSQNTNGIFTGTDFRPQYMAAVMAKNNVRGEFYDLNTQYEWQQKINPQLRSIERMLPYMSAPVGTLLLKPFGYIPYATAYRLWSFMNLLLLVGITFMLLAVYDLRSVSKSKSVLSKEELLVVIVSFAPFWFAVGQGQFSMIYTAAIAASYFLYSRHKKLLSGFILALIAIKPYLIVLPLLLFVLRKEWRVVQGIVLGLLISGLIALILVGPEGVFRYLSFLREVPLWGDRMGVVPMSQPNLKGLLLTLFHTSFLNTEIAVLWVGLSVLAVTYAFAVWNSRRHAEITGYQWGIMIACVLLISPHIHFHDFAIFILPLVLFLRSTKSSSHRHLAKLTIFILCFFAPFVFWRWAFLVPAATVAFFTVAALKYRTKNM